MKSKLFFYLLGLTNGFNMSAYKRFVNESQYWSPEQIEKYQMEMLTPLLQHAFDHVPYYRRLFDSLNLKPIDIRKTSDLHILPVIRKQDIMQNPHDFIPDNYKNFKHKKGHTGGTSGSPFPYYVDIKAWGMNWAVNMRTFDWAGYQYGKDRLAVMAGGSLVPTEGKGFKKRIMHYVNNYFTMQITHMDSTIMDEYYSEIKKQKIRFLRGYPSAIYSFAEYLSEKQKQLPLEAVITTAEMLYPHQRDLMKKVFACDVFDTYGCRDGMGMAVECEKHNGMHICPELSIMHIVDESGQEVKAGDTGEVVLTSLYNYSMPFIRYAPGDMAIKSDKKCDCGRSFPMIDKIIGRSSDIIKLINGRVINGLSIPFKELTTEVEKFQIVQEASDRVEVLLVPRGELTQEHIESIEKMLSFHCGEEVKVKAKIVDSIEVPKSEKFRYVISKVH
jgi:phenylacetate-CoA ligase